MTLKNAVVYIAPNRAHHYEIARELKANGLLRKFYCAATRLVARNRAPDLWPEIVHVDFVQSIYVAMRKLAGNGRFAEKMALLSRKVLDERVFREAGNERVLLGYSGAFTKSLTTRGPEVCGIVEAVNTHVDWYDDLLRKEAQSLGICYNGSASEDRNRRLAEYRAADAITAPSRAALESYVKLGIPRERMNLHWIRPSVARLSVESCRKLERGPIKVLFVGQVTLRKGVKYLIEAASRMDPSLFQFRIVGPKIEPTGLHGITIPGNCLLLGALSGAALLDEYGNADLFVLPSLEEGLALVLFEAMSAGLPIVATCQSGFSDLCSMGAKGKILSSGCSAGLQTAILDYSRFRENLRADGIANIEVAKNLVVNPPQDRIICSVVEKIYAAGH